MNTPTVSAAAHNGTSAVAPRERGLDFLEDARPALIWKIQNDAYLPNGLIARLMYLSDRQPRS